MKIGRPRQAHCKRGHELVGDNVYFSINKDHPKGLRQCLTCRKQRGVEYHIKNKAKINARSAKWQIDHPEETRRKGTAFRRKSLGWSEELFDKTIASQGNLCAICGVELNTAVGTKAHADHKHVDPPVPRGILCSFCNTGIGFLKDSPEILRAAADYLESFNMPCK